MDSAFVVKLVKESVQFAIVDRLRTAIKQGNVTGATAYNWRIAFANGSFDDAGSRAETYR